MTLARACFLSLSLALALSGCGDDDGDPDAGAADAGPGDGVDAGPADSDSGPPSSDAGLPDGRDAGPGDADAGPPEGMDAGPPEDTDAGPPEDTDAGPPGGTDAGPQDAGPGGRDAGPGGRDAGPADSDAGPASCEDPPLPSPRIEPTTCAPCRPPGATAPPGRGACSTDADCTEGVNGRCVLGRIAFCTYDECFMDTDCEDTELCACDGGNGGGNACIEAQCRTNADCPGSFQCAPSLGSCGFYLPPVGYYCHTSRDTCATDADCEGFGGGGFGTPHCSYHPELGFWQCTTRMCVG